MPKRTVFSLPGDLGSGGVMLMNHDENSLYDVLSDVCTALHHIEDKVLTTTSTTSSSTTTTTTTSP